MQTTTCTGVSVADASPSLITIDREKYKTCIFQGLDLLQPYTNSQYSTGRAIPNRRVFVNAVDERNDASRRVRRLSEFSARLPAGYFEFGI